MSGESKEEIIQCHLFTKRFVEWVKDNYTEVRVGNEWGWVNFHENTVLVHGSEYHYRCLLKESKTTDELIEEFINKIETKNENKIQKHKT